VVPAGSDKFTFSVPAGSSITAATFVNSNFEPTAQKGTTDWPPSYHASGLQQRQQW
jgi:hypothetical protein